MEAKGLKFDLKLKEIPVTLVGSDGVEKNCTLRELDGVRKGDYLEGMKDNIVLSGGEVQSVKSFAGLEAALLCLCLYDENNKLMSKDDIQKFPSTVQTALFQNAQELSGLDEDAKAEAKND